MEGQLRKNSIFLLLSLVGACSVDTSGGVHGEVKKRGLVEVIEPGDEFEAPNSISGKAFQNTKMKIVQETAVVPLELGVTFGHEWCAYGLPRGPVELKFSVYHPDDGAGAVGFTSDRFISNDSEDAYCSLDAYTLGTEADLLEGEWTLRIWYLGPRSTSAILASSDFSVVPVSAD